MARSLGVEDLLERPARTLSKGERRRVELALVLAASAELYVLDEPASGLDPRHLEDLKKVVRSLVAKGSTVLLSTHLLREWEDCVDFVVLLHRGRVVREGDLSSLLAPYRLWVPTTSDPSPLPPEAFPLTGRALAPFELEPPAGWSAQSASLADVFLKETADV
jgi:ABC-type multidrug transport system ATPase subunit